MLMRNWMTFGASAALLVGSTAVFSAPVEVPEALKPWVNWVLKGEESRVCPFVFNNASTRRCAWPGPLEIKAEVGGGRFIQTWTTYTEDFVTLPGNHEAWPQDVKVNGKSLPVVTHRGFPSINLLPGKHVVTGSFAWRDLPQNVQIPREVGLIALQVNGKPIAMPDIDIDGKLWLRSKVQDESLEAQNSEDIRVQRKVNDDIPLTVLTRLELDISGKGRELALGRILPEGLIPMSLDSALPGKLTPEGNLTLQVRAGRWSIEINARALGPVATLTPPKIALASWPSEEVWAFEAHPELRLVDIEGIDTIDPQQTTVPAEWKKLPMYRVRPADSLQIKEKKRGDSDPSGDQIDITRNIWLDFDGGGMTFQDQLKGSVRRSARLEMKPPFVLGRVAIDGQDQYITSLEDKNQTGIEVRSSALNLTTESRIETKQRLLPAAGWDFDAKSLGAILNLPPAWRVFHVSGVDTIRGSWVEQWTLLNFFLALVITIAIGKLMGLRPGLLALITMILLIPEAEAPRWGWFHILVALSLLKVLPDGRLRRAATQYRWLALGGVVLFTLPFLVQQVQQSIYPVLENQTQRITQPASVSEVHTVAAAMKEAVGGSALSPMTDSVGEDIAADVALDGEAIKGEAPPAAPRPEKQMKLRGAAPQILNQAFDSRSGYGSNQAMQNLQQHDPKSIVQTGKGLPGWTWNRVTLGWSGPVAKDHVVRLWLSPPWMTRLLSLLRVALFALLIALLAGMNAKDMNQMKLQLSKLKRATTAILILLTSLTFGNHQARADLPNSDMLQELKIRLLRAPNCLPNCAEITRAVVDAEDDSLTIRLEIHANERTAVPLPGDARKWMPTKFVVDGKADAGLFRDELGQLWAEMAVGTHQVELSGSLGRQKSLQIPLPLKPRQIRANLRGWTLDGVHEDGLADDSIQLSRITKTVPGTLGTKESFEGEGLPPFVSIEREIVLGLSWQTITRVRRLTPVDTAILLRVPLLKGEAVTSTGMRVEKGFVLVTLPPQQASLEWSSVLEVTPELQLTAPKDVAWMEEWNLRAGPIWHFTFEGLAPVSRTAPDGMLVPRWRPWPGETLNLKFMRPEAAGGQILTIDKVVQTNSPGKRSSDISLDLTIRTSRGGQNRIILPEGADVHAVKIDGVVQPLRLEGSAVILPLLPGKQDVRMEWRDPNGLGFTYKTVDVKLGVAAINGEVIVKMPTDRWTLLVGGPQVGPAVRFWGLALVILLVAFGLSRLGITPLTTSQWFLLGLGLSQAKLFSTVVVVGFLLAIGLRARIVPHLKGAFRFDLMQLTLTAWALAATAALVNAITKGFLGSPAMQISGNNSWGGEMHWFVDKMAEATPQAWILSMPIFVYRMCMLGWALWLAMALLRWVRWIWDCFSAGEIWRSGPKREKIKPTTTK